MDDVQQHVQEHGYDENAELEGVCLMSERMILVDSALERAHRMEIIIHELLHAYDITMTENRVRGISRTIARALWRLNYRHKRDLAMPAKGSKHYCAKITEEIVPEIRRLIRTGMRLSQIAERFGVSYYSIRDLKDGETWKHVPDPDAGASRSQ